MAEASFLFDPENTKFKYPKISVEFTEETIFKAFIVYCNYNSEVPLSEELRSVCMTKPDSFDVKDSIEEKIRKLRRDGHNYSIDSFNQLMQVINSHDLVVSSINLQILLYQFVFLQNLLDLK